MAALGPQLRLVRLGRLPDVLHAILQILHVLAPDGGASPSHNHIVTAARRFHTMYHDTRCAIHSTQSRHPSYLSMMCLEASSHASSLAVSCLLPPFGHAAHAS